MWEIDLIGPLPGTKNGNKYILTVIDHYSRWAYAVSLKNKSAKNVIIQMMKIFDSEGAKP
ncbi:MAG: DDE-type integrase/transposase/recombinase [Culicoidibacterales bacterium]